MVNATSLRSFSILRRVWILDDNKAPRARFVDTQDPEGMLQYRYSHQDFPVCVRQAECCGVVGRYEAQEPYGAVDGRCLREQRHGVLALVDDQDEWVRPDFLPWCQRMVVMPDWRQRLAVKQGN